VAGAADATPPAEPAKPAQADDAAKPGKMTQAWDDTKDLFSTIWNKGRQELYIPGYTWHNPSTYTQAQRDGYTTWAWGIGYGRTWTSEANNDHTLFAMEFQDSHNDIQPIVGYAYQWMWGKPGELRAGAGLAAGITARYDGYCKYCPIPYVIPIASISYWRISLMGTYVPKYSDRGNIAFFWAKVNFD
jgi:palmitoyl transferase